jgi:hypothetical protein
MRRHVRKYVFTNEEHNLSKYKEKDVGGLITVLERDLTTYSKVASNYCKY